MLRTPTSTVPTDIVSMIKFQLLWFLLEPCNWDLVTGKKIGVQGGHLRPTGVGLSAVKTFSDHIPKS